MSRKLIFGIALFGLLCIVLAAPLHEAAESYHVPFPIDGDFGAMTLAIMIGICTGMAALAIPVLAAGFALVMLLRCSELPGALRFDLLEFRNPLHSPPPKPVSLRI